MELRNLILAFGIICLTSCNTQLQPTDQLNSSQDLHEQFIFNIPAEASHKYIRSDQSIAYATFEAPTTDYVASDYSIHFYPPNSISSLACSSALTGASKMTSLENGEWGRVDLGELRKQEGYQPPYDTTNVKCGSMENVYAFCSEKEGKTVVICVNQITDNPALAEQIFSTFRWTE